VPAGIIATTGVGGLTLRRPCHLTRRPDDRQSAIGRRGFGRRPTGDGERQNKDLFWALRGAANFGVVTSFYSAPMPYIPTTPGRHLGTREGPVWYREFITQASEESERVLRLSGGSAGPRSSSTCTTRKCAGWCGATLADGEGGGSVPADPLFPARGADLVGPIPHPMLQSMFDALYPPASCGIGRRIS
jgi:hypothetical protein